MSQGVGSCKVTRSAGVMQDYKVSRGNMELNLRVFHLYPLAFLIC